MPTFPPFKTQPWWQAFKDVWNVSHNDDGTIKGVATSFPTATQPSQTPRYDNTAWRARGPYELWLEDFGTGGNITYATAGDDSAATGDDCGPIINAANAKAVALNPNRGGVIIKADRQRYSVRTSPSIVTLAGYQFEGIGAVGQARDIAKGCTQFLCADGITFMRIDNTVRGPILKNFHCFHASGANTAGNGISLSGDSFFLDNVGATDFLHGYGFKTDSATYGSQYGTFFQCKFNANLTGIWVSGFAPTGTDIIGCFGDGFNTLSPPTADVPLAGSVGILVDRGDNTRLFGTRVHVYETGIYHNNNGGSMECYGTRFESNNVNTKLGAASRAFQLYGGWFDDNLLQPGQVSIGIDIVNGASDYLLMPGGTNQSKSGAIFIRGHIKGRGTIIHPSQVQFEVGANGTGTYTLQNAISNRLLDVTGADLATLRQVVGTLIADMQARNLVG